MRCIKSAITILLLSVVFAGCATSATRNSRKYTPGDANTSQISALSQEYRKVREEQQRLEQANLTRAQAFFETGRSPLDSLRPMSSKERDDKVGTLIARGIELWGEISERVEVEFDSAIVQEFGPSQPLQNDEVMLEALDAKGDVIEVPVTVEIRPLRRISDAASASRLPVVLGPGRPALAAYDGLPIRVASSETEFYRRIYTGQAADAIAMEARSLVMLKGGEWLESSERDRVANAIAVRGLDMNLGLHTNDNTTYDDTMFIVLEGGDQGTKAVEYRATTESSSTRSGVGRLAASQVTYQRGLHKGRDPAYRLKGNQAEGTRRGRKGTYDILGANLHSAYSSRKFDSTTPLSPNVSLGCQVVATSKRSFESNMVKYLEKEGINHFLYTIVEDDEMEIFARILRESSVQSILVYAIDRSL